MLIDYLKLNFLYNHFNTNCICILFYYPILLKLSYLLLQNEKPSAIKYPRIQQIAIITIKKHSMFC